MAVVLSRLWTKVHDTLEGYRRPLSMHLTDCLCRVSFRRYSPLKLPLSCEVVQKVVFVPPICRGTPQILDMRFQIAVTSEHVADFG